MAPFLRLEVLVLPRVAGELARRSFPRKHGEQARRRHANHSAAGRIRTCICAVLETAASAVGLLRRSSALSRIRTCIIVILGHEPLPNWATRASQRCTLNRSKWSRRDSNPHPLGASQGSSQLEDGPKVFRRCEKDSNLQPRPSEGRARPFELSQHIRSWVGGRGSEVNRDPRPPTYYLLPPIFQWSRQDSNLQRAVSETAASAEVGL